MFENAFPFFPPQQSSPRSTSECRFSVCSTCPVSIRVPYFAVFQDWGFFGRGPKRVGPRSKIHNKDWKTGSDRGEKKALIFYPLKLCLLVASPLVKNGVRFSVWHQNRSLGFFTNWPVCGEKLKVILVAGPRQLDTGTF